MSAVILMFPKSDRLPRAAIEATIERLIDLLDDSDAPTMECEPEVDEDSDGTGLAAAAAPMPRLVSRDRGSSDTL